MSRPTRKDKRGNKGVCEPLEMNRKGERDRDILERRRMKKLGYEYAI